MSKENICPNCGFVILINEEDVEAEEWKRDLEWERNFPGIPDEDKALVCTDCFIKIMLTAESEGLQSSAWREGHEDIIGEASREK
jgi:DNA-directed RNA polymerase subunit RPC12/RpoP